MVKGVKRSWLRSALLGMIFIMLAVAASPARAQSEAAPQDAITQARAAFMEGADLARQERWTDALAAFERSSGLRDHAGTTYNIAFCERALGRFTRARKMFAKALADDAARGGELTTELRENSIRYLKEAETSLGRVTVTADADGALIAVDGRPLEPVKSEGDNVLLTAGTREPGPAEAVPARRFEVLLDPGSHVFVLSKEGFSDRVETRSLAAGTSTEIELSFPPPRVAPETVRKKESAPPPSRATAVPSNASEPEAPGSGMHLARNIGFVAGAVGIAAIGVGGYFGLRAFSKKEESDDLRRDGQCFGDCYDAWQDGRAAAVASNVSMAVGVVALGVGAYLVLTSDSGESGRSVGVGARLTGRAPSLTTEVTW